jgi:deoxyribodipyrimidine photolyase-related protein
MTEAVLIFPHHLFKQHPCLKKERELIFVEDPLFFGDKHYPALFHQQKLLFHRASMKQFADALRKKGYRICYEEAKALQKGEESYTALFKRKKVTALFVAEFNDFILEKRIRNSARHAHVPLSIAGSPAFLTQLDWIEDFFKGKKHFSFQPFYIAQRKRLGLLVDKSQKPLGGKWSFDAMNRKRAPQHLSYFHPKLTINRLAVRKEIPYILRHFSKNYGSLQHFTYPTTHLEAERFLEEFVQKRLELFGDYEDAILQKESTLFHSMLSPLLNVGLLTPSQVIEQVIKAKKIPLNSLEGFIRQVIGWREFIRAVYHLRGVDQRTRNFWKHKRQLPHSFYTGTTGILPIDQTIKKILDHAYCHHIERLMILGNFMLLCEFDPDSIYRWFMEMFIDAYDWVMVPNVYGMSQFA